MQTSFRIHIDNGHTIVGWHTHILARTQTTHIHSRTHHKRNKRVHTNAYNDRNMFSTSANLLNLFVIQLIRKRKWLTSVEQRSASQFLHRQHTSERYISFSPAERIIFHVIFSPSAVHRLGRLFSFSFLCVLQNRRKNNFITDLNYVRTNATEHYKIIFVENLRQQKLQRKKKIYSKSC